MIVYSIEACQKSNLITRFVVSTEDAEIKDISVAHSAEVVDRPCELAQDETKTAPVMRMLLRNWKNKAINLIMWS